MVQPGMKPPLDVRAPNVQRRKRSPVASLATLARWQFGQTWRMLLVANVGVLAAVALICLIPLYSSVALSAGLRDSLAASPENSYVVESGTSALYDHHHVQDFQQTVTRHVKNALQQYVLNQPIFSTSIDPLVLARIPFSETDLDFTGFAQGQIPQHVKLLEGHLPTIDSDALEFVTTPQGLADLESMQKGYKVGSVFQYPLVLNDPNTPYLVTTTIMVPLRDVGVISISSPSEQFWHGASFQTVAGGSITAIQTLISNEALSEMLERVEAEPRALHYQLYTSIRVSWFYPLNLAQFNVGQLDLITARMSHLLADPSLSGNPLAPYVQQMVTLGPMSIFQYYSDRVTLLRVPVGTLVLLSGGLILFAVSIMVSVLVEQQDEQIALLRSRGASRGQVVAALSVQGGVLALPVLVLGPLLAYVLAIWLSGMTLQGNDRSAINVLAAQPVGSVLSVFWIALVVIIVGLLVMTGALFQKLRATHLQRRRESARPQGQSFWERWRLDLVGTVIALVAASFAYYLAHSGLLSARVRALILPLILLGVFLGVLVAIVLLLFRWFPLILLWLARLAQRSRGSSAVLALTQLARAPRSTLRLALLLAFTLAFAIFSLTFNASQTRQLTDGIGFQVGSDFSGKLGGSATLGDWQSAEQQYAQVPGVLSATIGHLGIMQSNNGLNNDVLAVDASTCAQTMYWSAPDSPQAIAPLLRQLVAQRQSSIQASLIPAIVDESAAQSLGLAIGMHFGLSEANNAVTFVVVGIVQHIPGLIDDSSNAGAGDITATGGVLADYMTLASVQANNNSEADSAESMWLKTSSDPAMLARVRQELVGGQLQLSNLSDRRALAAGLAYDPLIAALGSGLLVGGAVALVLGLSASLLGSWNNARKRVLNVALMRALGHTPGQLVRIVLWEQGILYILALVLGIGGGLLLSWTLTPGLLYTPALSVGTAQNVLTSPGLNLPGPGELYLVQNVPMAQAIFPFWPVVVVSGIVLGVCILALGNIVRLVTRPALSEVLRLNDD